MNKIFKYFWFLVFGFWFLLIKSQSPQWKGITKNINLRPDRMSIDSSTNSLLLSNGPSIINDVKYYYCALWNGTEFDSVAPRADKHNVFQIIKYKGEYYANAYDKILKKAGTYSWTPVATINSGNCSGLYIYKNDLIAYGAFNGVNGVTASYIAKFDGINWSPMDTLKFVAGFISTVEEFNGNLYIGGNMIASNWWCDNLGMYNGQHFVNVDNNAMAGGSGGIGKIIKYKNALYMSGGFHKNKGNPANGFVKWDGNNWDTLGGGFYYDAFGITDMTVYHDELYCIGRFQEIAGINSNHMFKFDGNTFYGGNVCDFQLLNLWMGIEVYDDTLYVCGGFNKICNDSARYIAKWLGNASSFTSSVSVVSIKENSIKNQHVKIYPNPASNILHITTEQNQNTFSEIEITNSLGQTLIKQVYNPEVDVSRLPPGCYVLKIISKNKQVYHAKFLRE